MTTPSPEPTLDELAREHLWMPYSPPGHQGRAFDEIRFLERGDGTRMWAPDGTEYLDGISALEAMILGFGDRDVIEAMHAQAQELAFLDVFRFAAPVQTRLAAELAAISPGLKYVHFTPGGAEADEVAMKLARHYHHLRGESHRMKVITRRGSFHGVTQGAMALDGHYFASRNVIYDGGMSWGRTASPRPPYPPELGRAGRHLASVTDIEATILAEGPETVAAVVVDPMSTAIAVAIPPDQYLRDLRALCDRHGILLIADEVICGMGRTGRLFGVQHSGIVPDLLTMSKGLSSGYAPIGACLVGEHVAHEFLEHREAFLHGHTYAGHPVAAAAARAVVAKVTRERLWERAAELGERLLDGLRGLSGHRHFWDARGRGLLAGVEIVADPDAERDFANPTAAGNALRIACRDRGLACLILHPGNVLFMAPPLVSTPQDIDRIVEIVDAAMGDIEEGSFAQAHAEALR
jgi:adenosylmethionine-8-amino-7-oxononanoate aminotransferase